MPIIGGACHLRSRQIFVGTAVMLTINDDPRRVDIQVINGERATLGVVEASKHLGFEVRRFYFITDVQSEHARGNHAHRALQQFVVCLRGSFRLTLENARGLHTFELNTSSGGVLVPPGCWRTLDMFSPDILVGVLASDEYDESDYIRDYETYRAWTKAQAASQDVPYLPLKRQHAAISLELERALTSALHSGIYIGGREVQGFEEDFAAYCGSLYAVGCGNGLDALVLALEALEIGPGDEVIVPANSFIASALAVTMVGATPVFADVDPDTHGLTAASVRPAITPRTRAIMPVHLYGIPVDMDEIVQVAEEHDLRVVEDAAQAHGARFRGRVCGSLGDIAAFSFYPTKVLGALGDSGAVVTNDAQLADRVRLLSNYGSRKKYHHERVGRNQDWTPSRPLP